MMPADDFRLLLIRLGTPPHMPAMLLMPRLILFRYARCALRGAAERVLRQRHIARKDAVTRFCHAML